jgi:hypothetical protein
MLALEIRLQRIPGPSALLYYQNTEMRGFVARIFVKYEFICSKSSVVTSHQLKGPDRKKSQSLTA